MPICRIGPARWLGTRYTNPRAQPVEMVAIPTAAIQSTRSPQAARYPGAEGEAEGEDDGHGDGAADDARQDRPDEEGDP